MAKSNRPVNTQMPSQRPRTANSGQTRAPFDHPRTGGDGGSNIPTHTMESLGETPQRTVSASFASAPAEGSRQKRRYPMGGKE